MSGPSPAYTRRMRIGRVTATIAAISGGFALASAVALAGSLVNSDHEGKANGIVYRSSTVEFAGSAGTVAKCPDRNRITGGGAGFNGDAGRAAFDGLGPDYLAPHVPARKAFAGEGEVTGIGQDFTVFAICARSKGLTYERKVRTVTAQGQVVSTTAKCPAGTSVTGGGFHSTGGSDQVLATDPVDDQDQGSKKDNGWEARIVPGGGFETITVNAVCSSKLHLAYRHNATSGSGVLSKSVSCPADAAVTGGGAALSGGVGAVLSSSRPADISDANTTPEDGWAAKASVESGSRDLTVFAICKL
jgi:hypothetical protein